MKRFLVVLLFVVTSAHAATADDYFAQQRWKDALSAYKKSEFPTTTTLERMGTCAAHLNRHADAVLYWRRAQRHSAWGRYLYFGRMVAGAQVMAGATRVTHPVVSAVRNGLCSVPMILWQLLLLILWGLLLWRGKQMWQQGQIVVLSLIVGSMLIIVSITYYCYTERTIERAVITESATLRTGPGERYAQLTTLTPASEVVVQVRHAGGSSGPYYKVTTGAHRGWVSQKSLRAI